MSEPERKFINTFAQKAAHDYPNQVTVADIARFRLLATVVGTDRNDQRALGVHDANILFAERNGITLDHSEINGLVTSGLEYYATENTPLWHWYSKADAYGASLAFFSIQTGTERRRAAGALLAMKAIHEPLPTDKEFDRQFYVKWWLRQDEMADVKVAALGYLGELGTTGDLLQHGRSFSNEEAKKILVRPARAKGLGFGLGQVPPTDPAGKACWEAYHAQELTKLDDASLSAAADEESIFDLEAKFVLAERQYRRDGTELRAASKMSSRHFLQKNWRA